MMTDKPESTQSDAPQKILPLGFSSPELTLKTSIGPSLRAFFITLPFALFIVFWSFYTQNLGTMALLGVFIPGIWILIVAKKAGYVSYLFLTIIVALYVAAFSQTAMEIPTNIAYPALFLGYPFITSTQWLLFFYLFNQKINYEKKTPKENIQPTSSAQKIAWVICFFVLVPFGIWLYFNFHHAVEQILRCNFEIPGAFTTHCEFHRSIYQNLLNWLLLFIFMIIYAGIVYALMRTPIRKYTLYISMCAMVMYSANVVGIPILEQTLLQNDRFIRSFCPDTIGEANRQNLTGCHPDSVR